MMRWPPAVRPFLLQLLVATLLLPMGSASADTIIGQPTYVLAGRGDIAARQALQMQFFRDAYQFGASAAAIGSDTGLPGAMDSLDRTILWPVDRDGIAWPVLDHGKHEFGWHQWPRVEYDSRYPAFNVASVFISAEDRVSRFQESYPGLTKPDFHASTGLMSVDVAEARLPALLIQPVLAYYRMYGELPATPGDAYRELRLAMIDAAELELLEHYTPEFYAAVGCIQLRLIPHRGSDDLLEANAFRDPVQSTFVLETRRLPPAAKFTDRLGGELSYSTPGRGSEYTSVFEGPRLTRWATWREADIPVIASPVTDFLRHGPEIPSFVPLTKGQLEALGDSIRIGPVFSKYEESRVAPNGHL